MLDKARKPEQLELEMRDRAEKNCGEWRCCDPCYNRQGWCG